jgi:hypothetical protein
MSHALTNRLANPVLRRLLRTPLGRRLGRTLAVLRYTGTRTGRAHDLVCEYALDGERVWILVGQAARKTWWRNLRREAAVDVWLAGERWPGQAVVVDGAVRPDEAVAGLTAYLRAHPAARRSLRLRGTTRDAVAEAARGAVLVRVRLG